MCFKHISSVLVITMVVLSSCNQPTDYLQPTQPESPKLEIDLKPEFLDFGILKFLNHESFNRFVELYHSDARGQVLDLIPKDFLSLSEDFETVLSEIEETGLSGDEMRFTSILALNQDLLILDDETIRLRLDRWTHLAPLINRDGAVQIGNMICIYTTYGIVMSRDLDYKTLLQVAARGVEHEGVFIYRSEVLTSSTEIRTCGVNFYNWLVNVPGDRRAEIRSQVVKNEAEGLVVNTINIWCNATVVGTSYRRIFGAWSSYRTDNFLESNMDVEFFGVNSAGANPADWRWSTPGQVNRQTVNERNVVYVLPLANVNGINPNLKNLYDGYFTSINNRYRHRGTNNVWVTNTCNP